VSTLIKMENYDLRVMMLGFVVLYDMLQLPLTVTGFVMFVHYILLNCSCISV